MSNQVVTIQLELPAERFRDLELLLSTTALRNRKDLFNHALTLLEWVVKEKSAGRMIASVDEESGAYSELVMPTLSTKLDVLGLPRILRINDLPPEVTQAREQARILLSEEDDPSKPSGKP